MKFNQSKRLLLTLIVSTLLSVAGYGMEDVGDKQYEDNQNNARQYRENMEHNAPTIDQIQTVARLNQLGNNAPTNDQTNEGTP